MLKTDSILDLFYKFSKSKLIREEINFEKKYILKNYCS